MAPQRIVHWYLNVPVGAALEPVKMIAERGIGDGRPFPDAERKPVSVRRARLAKLLAQTIDLCDPAGIDVETFRASEVPKVNRAESR